MPAKTSPEPSYLVYRDTGEHEGHGWIFNKSERCSGTEDKNLYTGDYSIVLGQGDDAVDLYDNKFFVIERKGSVAEFVGNITQKDKWDDFKNELARMEEFTHPFVICEFPLSLIQTYPRGSGIPKHIWPSIKVRPQFLLLRLEEIWLRFKTKFIFADAPGLGRDIASGLFKRVAEAWRN